LSTTARTKTGKLIRTARVASGVSQDRLARELGVSVATVRRLENGWRAPTSIEVNSIVRVLQMETAWDEYLRWATRTNGSRNGGGVAA
jgi:DNA-binding transcriptional regulator YiaG